MDTRGHCDIARIRRNTMPKKTIDPFCKHMDITGTLYIDQFMKCSVRWTTSIDEVTGPLFIDHLLMWSV